MDATATIAAPAQEGEDRRSRADDSLPRQASADADADAGVPAPAAADARVRLLDRLLAAHQTWFDVERGYVLAGKEFAGFAQFHATGERYVLSRKVQLWEASNHEYVFFDLVGRLDRDAYMRLVDFMKTEALALADPGPNHMSSNVALVLMCSDVAPDVGAAVRSTRFRKNYRFGFWGWTDLRVAVVDLAGSTKGRAGRVITNAAGKALGKTIRANLEPVAIER